MKRIAALVCSIIWVSALFGQSVHSSGDNVFNLYSIQNLGGGVHIVDMDTPHNTMYNPAAAAGFQRITADINYINLQGLGTVAGAGHAVNAGVSFPTKYGVLTGSLRWIGTNRIVGSTMDYGNVFAGNFTFSKEIYSDFYLGAGINVSAGWDAGVSTSADWGLGLNLGFLHLPGQIAFMKNFRWGASLTNMGKGFGDASAGYDRAIPGNFTLGAGAGFDIFDQENFRWSVSGDLRAPTFTDLKLDLGTDILIAGIVNVETSSSFSLRDAIAGEATTLIPSVGVSVKIPLGGKEKADLLGSSEMNINAAAAPLYDGLWAFGGGLTIPFGVLDDNPPELEVDFPRTIYISPNFDGIQDELIIPITVTDERHIKGYSLVIKNESGEIIKSIYNKNERPENESIKNLFHKIVSAKEGTAVPQSFRWDGKGDSGEMVPDGTYNFEIVFWDDNLNYTEPYQGKFIIDTVAPSVEVSSIEGTDLIFSPDGDGNKDVIQFTQSGSEESEWKGVITDASGNVVKEFVWYGTLDNAIWDGTDNDGNLVPDGVYQYEVIAIDEAGNTVKKEVENQTFWDDLSFEEELAPADNYDYAVIEMEDSLETVEANIISNIIVNTKKPPVHLYIDKAWFAPASETGEQEIVFTLDVPVKTGIVEWQLDILNTGGSVEKTFSSKEDGWGVIPETISYNGRNRFNSILSESTYKGKLSLRYQNGYNPEAESPEFHVDVTVPSARLSSAYDIFSPNGDNNKDEARFTQSGSAEDEWIGIIEDNSGKVIKQWSWKSGLESTLLWDGRDDEGKIAPDGLYNYYLTATDKAGNTGKSQIVAVRLDNSETEAAISVNLDAFSPNRDGKKDAITLQPIKKEGSSIDKYEIAVKDSTGQVVKNWSGNRSLLGQLNWDGKKNDGSAAPDGIYSASIQIVFSNGDVRSASSGTFVLDTVSPVIDISASYTLFSPDGDGRKDFVSIKQTSGREKEFYGEMSDSSGKVVRSWFWGDSLSSFDWEGNDESGNFAGDGRYKYTVWSEDAAGNRTVRVIDNLVIDTEETPVFLTAKNSAFSPSLDEGLNHQEFSIIVSNRRGIDSWKLEMKTAGRSVKTFDSEDMSEIPSKLNWDGKSESGTVVEGEYTAVFSIEYAKGNNPVIESTPFLVDSSAPEVRLSMSPKPFSPDDDNVDDELNISIAVDDLSPVKDWSMVINDPKNREFISFQGRGRPSERIIWDGRSMKGELVQSAEDYPYIFTITDMLGNKRTVEGVIPVDVLVVREGDRFKIQISSITFKPDSAEYNDAGDLKEKNEKILGRIAEILKKYSSYRIIIEGNAASTKYYDKKLAEKEEIEELQPLSLQRAETVQASLIDLGIARTRMDVEGKGGTNPVVPHSDLENAWKNRRVEFILLK
ncbi:FlgD immunoglobulin-like domain containing protein [Spirochaeta isovalerica]|uniref:Flagellar hook assembly protein FlgD/outer membrane protein OmpA-like peptidoglycan-associated protein n=1 Tax=Spirochaeta isovalerica TaxID=150 RepID=A0A841R624_9SPIO|nr:FlgD immunoglobulin-like domain containing protein [Spirochaeta isovalerica]MBB6478459.1 flagellar hook assembly protein FlgD/outer membrane protein OmpA-like peptidoglycan-associated protein [Spirochaeta isovalerica]